MRVSEELTAPGLVPLWLWGVLICIVATALTSLGLVLLKFSHLLNAKEEDPKKVVVYYRQPWWLVGFAIFVVAQIINLISMSMAPQVMLSSLGATALIFNAIFASIILEEELHLFEGGVMIGMACGVVLVIATTPVLHASSPTLLPKIVGPLFTPQFIGVAMALGLALLVLRFIVITEAIRDRIPDLEPFFWTVTSAVASGYTVNCFKATSEFIMGWPTTKPYLHWECYVVLACAILFGVAQVHCLNKALNLGRAMLVVPTYFALGLLAQLGISEVIVLDLPETPAKGALFAFGVVLIMFNIVVLVRAKISYEVTPEADFEEVMAKTFTSFDFTPKKGETTDASALLASTPSMPARHAKSLPEFGEDAEAARTPPKMRCESWSGWDADNFAGSFEGRERSYTVSVIGLGIA